VVSTIHWTEGHTHRSARWHSENAAPLPRRSVVADDRMKANDAYRQACEGTALLWQGDFLTGLSAHLRPGGEGWLILSDLAEHLGLRTRQQLLDAVQAAHLSVAEKTDIKPRHPRSKDTGDPLHAARSAETTSLWRLITTP
jgi:hypothetical protein